MNYINQEYKFSDFDFAELYLAPVLPLPRLHTAGGMV
jgi:hypothetical protein